MKERHIKTVYEKYSHHKVDDLVEFKKKLDFHLKEYYLNVERYKNRDLNLATNIFEVLANQNYMISGTFYIRGSKDGEYYQDADVFS